MKVYVAIGNSDDNLSQKEWKHFIEDVVGEVHSFGQEIQGEWYSEPVSQYQNACICVEVHDEVVQEFKDRLRRLAAIFRQDSIAFDEVSTTTLLVPGR
jgi:hypothetical protein